MPLAIQSFFTGQIAAKKSRKQYFRDHAMMERFFLSLKMERIWQKDYVNHAKATNDIASYIVGFYNARSLHSKQGNLLPTAF